MAKLWGVRVLAWPCNRPSIAAQGIMQTHRLASHPSFPIYLRLYAPRPIVMLLMTPPALTNAGLRGMLSPSVLLNEGQHSSCLEIKSTNKVTTSIPSTQSKDLSVEVKSRVPGFLPASGVAAQALRGGSKCLLATSGGGESSPGRTRSPFSRRDDVFPSILFRASSRRPRRAASLTSASSLEARWTIMRGNPRSLTMLPSELFSSNR
uniref:Uncharacterized protein n=1 Tax=Salix viminalis TaxID=40686 RepID=A0A6N2KIW5_SALVM